METVICLISVLGGVVYCQPSGHLAPTIREAVNEASQVRLAGNTRPEANAVTGWLQSQGFTIHGVQASGLMIDFSGTAAKYAPLVIPKFTAWQ